MLRIMYVSRNLFFFHIRMETDPTRIVYMGCKLRLILIDNGCKIRRHPSSKWGKRTRSLLLYASLPRTWLQAYNNTICTWYVEHINKATYKIKQRIATPNLRIHRSNSVSSEITKAPSFLLIRVMRVIRILSLQIRGHLALSRKKPDKQMRQHAEIKHKLQISIEQT